MQQGDPLLTRKEAATYLRADVTTLARWAYQGKGPRYSSAGGRCLYRQSDLDKWLEANMKLGAA